MQYSQLRLQQIITQCCGYRDRLALPINEGRCRVLIRPGISLAKDKSLFLRLVLTMDVSACLTCAQFERKTKKH